MTKQTSIDNMPAEQMLKLTQFAVEMAAEAMFTVSPDGDILSANKTACERLEYTREELTSMRIADIDPDYRAEKWPEHFDELRRLGKMRIETRHLAKSGRTFDVEVSISYFEFEGVEYCCSSIRDITQPKQAEQLLRLQREVLERVASTAGRQTKTLGDLCTLVQRLVPNTIVTVMLVSEDDGALRFVATGPGMTTSACQLLEPLFPARYAGSCGSAAYLKRAVIVEDTREDPHWAHLQHVVKSLGIYACWSIPILDERQQVLGTFAISHSQSASPSDFEREVMEMASYLASIAIRRQRFEEQLQTAHNQLAHFSRVSTMGEMASGIAHELNQPLTALVNDSYLLERMSQTELPEMPTLRQRANCIRQQAMRAAEIVTSMRSFAKKTTPMREEANLKRVIETALAVMEPELRDHGIRLTQMIGEGAYDLFVDGVQIQQIVVNLVRNAIDAMRDVDRNSRDLTIVLRGDGDEEVEIRVSDTGPGIDMEDPRLLFDAFHTTKKEGMGLGLTICRSIAEAHAGRLMLTESGPGGATFSLFLPNKKPTELDG